MGESTLETSQVTTIYGQDVRVTVSGDKLLLDIVNVPTANSEKQQVTRVVLPVSIAHQISETIGEADLPSSLLERDDSEVRKQKVWALFGAWKDHDIADSFVTDLRQAGNWLTANDSTDND